MSVEAAEALSLAAKALCEQRAYAKAEPLLIKANLILVQVLGAQHPNTILSLSSLGDAYAAQGKREEAETVYRQALANCQQVLSAEDPITAQVLTKLAALYKEWIGVAHDYSSERKERATLVQAFLSGDDFQWRHLHLPLPIDLARVLHKLALIYVAQEQWEQAEAAYQHVLSVYEKALGMLHSEVLECLDQLAFLFLQMGKVHEAEASLKRSLQVREELYGLDHPNLITNLNGLAGALIRQTQLESAERLLRRALVICRASLPPNHPFVALCLNNQAALYAAQGKQEQALELLRQVSLIWKELLATDHPELLALREQYQQLIVGLYHA